MQCLGKERKRGIFFVHPDSVVCRSWGDEEILYMKPNRILPNSVYKDAMSRNNCLGRSLSRTVSDALSKDELSKMKCLGRIIHVELSKKKCLKGLSDALSGEREGTAWETAGKQRKSGNALSCKEGRAIYR